MPLFRSNQSSQDNIKHTFKVEEKLAELERVKDPQALVAAFKSLGVDLMALAKLSGARQAVSF